MDNLTYNFSAEIWLWSARKSSWTFITVPKEASDHIRFFATDLQRGFKSLKVEAQIGDSIWQTSIFPSKEQEAYVLPIKKSVREAQSVTNGDTVNVEIRLIT